MGAKLYKQFQNFHNTIKLDKESSLLKEKRETLQSDIESKLPNILSSVGIEITKSDLSFFDQGSYRQNVSTGINSNSVDRDLAVEFELDIAEYDDPRKIKKSVRNSLKIENRRDPLIKEPCVTVKYLRAGEENIHLDFPIYAVYNGNRYLARGKENSGEYSWEQCDPHGLNDHMDDLFKGDAGNQFRRIVRYLKKWKLENYGVSYTKDQIPPSIGLTLLAGNFFHQIQSDGQDDDLSALLRVVKSIRNEFYCTDTDAATYGIGLNLPVRPWSNIFYKMSDAYQNTFYKKWCSLCDKVQAAVDATEEYEAAKFLRDIFGEDFELPDQPQTKTGSAKKENNYA